jgi:hypothetical protein
MSPSTRSIANLIETWPTLEDLLYHDGAFYFLTSQGHLVLCMPSLQPDATGGRHLVVDMEHLYFEPRHDDQLFALDGYSPANPLVLSMYLVRSREETLLVIRFQRPFHKDGTGRLRIWMVGSCSWQQDAVGVLRSFSFLTC